MHGATAHVHIADTVRRVVGVICVARPLLSILACELYSAPGLMYRSLRSIAHWLASVMHGRSHALARIPPPYAPRVAAVCVATALPPPSWLAALASLPPPICCFGGADAGWWLVAGLPVLRLLGGARPPMR